MASASPGQPVTMEDMTGTMAQPQWRAGDPWTPPRNRSSEETVLPRRILEDDSQGGASTSDEVSAAAPATSHPAGLGGSVAIDLIHKFKNELRGEMSELKNEVEKRMENIERELKIKETKDTTRILSDDMDNIKMKIEEMKN